MPYRPIEFRTNYTYHLYNRGINHQKIFLCDENWGYFIRQMRKYFVPEAIDVISYCLMPTHYHFLVRLKTDDLSKLVMQPFILSYTKAVNKQQGRSGPLFQGRFKAKLVDKDQYLLHLSRYIHLNPVAAGLASQPEDWIYSSYLDTIGLRQGTLPAPDTVLSQFPNREAYREFVESFRDEDVKQIKHLLFDDEGQ